MELSLVMRLRIAAVMALGACVLGFGGWPLVRPTEPLGTVTLFEGGISLTGTLVCLLLAFVVGVTAYLVSIPYGRQIAPLAVPTGVSVWAIRTGDMSSLIRVNLISEQRQALYSFLKWEGFFWLMIILAGYLGVFTVSKFIKSRPGLADVSSRKSSKANQALSLLSAALVIIIIVQFAIVILAQDVKMSDSRLGTVIGQPEVGQIAFAVIVSFGLAGFVVKKFLDVGYVLTTIFSAFVTLVGFVIWSRVGILGHMAENWPVVFFPRAICAILPIQMISFGAIGAIAGYWLAVKFKYWRKHSSSS